MAVSVVLGTFSLIGVCFGQSDIDGLKSSHKLLAETVTSANVDLFVRRIDPQALGFFKNSQSVVQFSTRNTVKDMAPSLLAELSAFMSVTMQDKYRVIGDTGIVCSTFSRTPTTGQDKKKRTEYNRATYVYARSQGTWLLVSWHTSNIPLK
jgi:hypothetical protein